MKKIIVIADDFGFSPEVNKAIVDLYKKKSISGASLLPNGPSFDEAILLAKKYKIEIGLHLNLTQGKAVFLTGKTTITDKHGNFLGKEKLLIRSLLNQIKISDLNDEITSQINKMMDKVSPVFANAHQNVHLYPGIFEIYLNAVEKVKIPYIRPPVDSALLDINSWYNKPHRKMIMYVLGKRCEIIGKKKKVNCLEKGFSLTLNNCYNKDSLTAILSKIKASNLEMSVHPGEKQTGNYQFKTYLIKQREQELSFLSSSDFINTLKSLNYKIIPYSKVT
jgi:chitin disaccharide deacetylase